MTYFKKVSGNSNEELPAAFKETNDNLSAFSERFENENSSLYLFFNDDSLKENFKAGEAYYEEMSRHFTEIQFKYESAKGSLGLWAKDGVFYNDMQRAFDNIDGALKEVQRKGPYNTTSSFLFKSLGD